MLVILCGRVTMPGSTSSAKSNTMLEELIERVGAPSPPDGMLEVIARDGATSSPDWYIGFGVLCTPAPSPATSTA